MFRFHTTNDLISEISKEIDRSKYAAQIVVDEMDLFFLNDSLLRNIDRISLEIIIISNSNKKSLKISCEICGYKPIEVTDAKLHSHHIKFQSSADEYGNVGKGLHKNQLSNIVTVCHICHTKIHDDKIKIPRWTL